MKVKYTIYQTDGTETILEVDWHEMEGNTLSKIRKICGLYFNDEPPEHASVLHNGRPHDMFVSEYSAMDYKDRGPLPRNEAATTIYRCYSMEHNPKQDPEDLPAIYGTAILFHKKVWF